MALSLLIVLLVVVALAPVAVNDTSNQLALELATVPVCPVYEREDNVTVVYLVSKGSDVSQFDIQNRFGSKHERCFANYLNESQSNSMDAAGKLTGICLPQCYVPYHHRYYTFTERE